MRMKLSKDTILRSLWTGLEAIVALAIVYLSSVSAWWAAPIALALAGLKSHVLDVYAKRAQDKETVPPAPPVREVGP